MSEVEKSSSADTQSRLHKTMKLRKVNKKAVKKIVSKLEQLKKPGAAYERGKLPILSIA